MCLAMGVPLTSPWLPKPGLIESDTGHAAAEEVDGAVGSLGRGEVTPHPLGLADVRPGSTAVEAKGGKDAAAYDLTAGILQVLSSEKRVVGYLTGNQEPDLNQEFQGLNQLLTQTYEVRPVDLNQGRNEVPPEISSICDLPRQSSLLNRAISALLALPFSGAWVTDTLSIPFRSPRISLRRAPGWARTGRIVPSE